MILQHTSLFLFNLITVVSGCQLWTNCTTSYGQLLNVAFDPPGCNGTSYAWQFGTNLTISASFKSNQPVENAQFTIQALVYKADCLILGLFPYTFDYSSTPVPWPFQPEQICSSSGGNTSICPLQPNQEYNVSYTHTILGSIIPFCYKFYVNLTGQIIDQSTSNSIACFSFPGIAEGPPPTLDGSPESVISALLALLSIG